jgi:uncharacterized membrane-anchored protein
MRAITIAYLCALALITTAFAQTSPQAPAQKPKLDPVIEYNEAFKAGFETATKGEATVDLLDQAKIKLPPDFYFIKSTEAARMLRAMGNPVSKPPTGLILSEKHNWLVVINFIKEGYVKNDDAKEWKADELLASLKEGNDETNKERVKMGFPAIQILGWVEPPKFDALNSRLIWSLGLKQDNEAVSDNKGVNYNTYALGRYGYFSLNMVSNEKDIAEDKITAAMLLNNLNYNAGHRYGDFNPTTDNVASYGLAALVGAGIAKKLGFFALIGVFFVKFGKLLLIPLIFGGGFLMRLFKKKQD